MSPMSATGTPPSSAYLDFWTVSQPWLIAHTGAPPE
jgi:hypothetical protein